jgi:hypothetical protein
LQNVPWVRGWKSALNECHWPKTPSDFLFHLFLVSKTSHDSLSHPESGPTPELLIHPLGPVLFLSESTSHLLHDLLIYSIYCVSSPIKI